MVRWCALASTAVAIVGCASDPCEPPVCDVRLSGCQSDIMEATACLRGVEPREVEVEIVDFSDFLESVKDRPQEFAEGYARRAAALSLLGLEPAGELDDVLDAHYERVGAIYDSEEDRISVIDRGRPLESERMTLLLVHELAHALQAEVLGELAPGTRRFTVDGALAEAAILEGDATVTTDRAAMLVFGGDPDDPDWSRIYRGWSADNARWYLRTEPYRVSLASRYFSYAFGAEFVHRVRSDGGDAAVHDWLRAPPVSTADLMAGPQEASEVDVAARRRPEAEPPILVPDLPDHDLVRADTLGAFVFEGFVAAVLGAYELAAARDLTEPGERSAIEELFGATGRLRADHLSLWVNPQTDAAAVVYRVRFSRAATRDALIEVLGTSSPGTGAVIASEVDGDLLVVGSEDEAWLAELDPQELTWSEMEPGARGDQTSAMAPGIAAAVGP